MASQTTYATTLTPSMINAWTTDGIRVRATAMFATKTQRTDQSTEGTTDSDQQDRQRSQYPQDDRYRRPGPMLYAVDLHGRVGVGEPTAYSCLDRTTSHCRQRVLTLAHPRGPARRQR